MCVAESVRRGEPQYGTTVPLTTLAVFQKSEFFFGGRYKMGTLWKIRLMCLFAHFKALN